MLLKTSLALPDTELLVPVPEAAAAAAAAPAAVAEDEVVDSGFDTKDIVLDEAGEVGGEDRVEEASFIEEPEKRQG